MRAAPSARFDQLDQNEVREVLEALRPERLSARTRPVIEQLLLDFGASELALLAPHLAFDLLNPLTLEHLQRFSSTKIVGINETTRDAIRAQLLEGVRAGEGAKVLARRVRAVFADATRWRALTIARTESHTSASFATYEAQRLSGVVEQRKWIHSGLGRNDRDGHIAMSGQVVGISEDFTNPLTGNTARYPGGFNRASEDIRCRCASVAHIRLDAADVTEAERAYLEAWERRLARWERKLAAALRVAFREQRAEALAVLARFDVRALPGRSR